MMPHHEKPARVVRHAPPLLRLARALERRGMRGGTALERLARRFGMLDRIARYDLGRGVAVDVPLALRALDAIDVREYEAPFVASLAGAIAAMRGATTLFDCGADFGLISLRLLARCPTIARVIAIEPNDDMHAALARNVTHMPPGSRAMRAAAGDAAGRGTLRSPAHDPDSAHARYVEPTPDGAVPIVRLDDIPIPSGHAVAIKCDVEGSELAVVLGAREHLRRAPSFVVGFEAHPAQVDRTGIEPMRIVRELRAIRPCSVDVAERPDCDLAGDAPLFDQLGERRVVNIVCASLLRDPTPSTDTAARS
jgi:FkbM family methyltransferase